MNLIDLLESPQLCPECGGPAFTDLLLAEKKDACYHKVRSRYKVWPSAYASGALVQCRKKGAANWGNKNESQEPGLSSINDDDWYEIDDQDKVYKQSPPSRYRPLFGTEIKLDNGHTVVRGMTLKARRLKQGKDQDVAEGLGQPKGAGQALQSLQNLALMKSALTFQQLRQAGRESMITDAINACMQFEQSYLQNKQQGNAIFVRALRDEIDNFSKGYPINSSMPEDNTPELGDLLQGKLGKVNFQQGVAEVSRDTLKSYQQKVSADSMKHSADPTKRSQQKANRSVAGFAKAQNRLEQGVAGGSTDTIYPNATVIKSKNGRPVGEIYQDGNSWGCFHYRADRGYDMIDSREDAIQALKDLHQETGRGGPDYTIKGVAEGSLYEGVNDPHIFKCIFLFGPMGAGKSTVAGPLLSHTGLRSVNLDNFNEMFIKKGQVPTGHLAPDQLEKSWQLSQIQQQNFVDGRLGIIIDGSGRNPETALSVIKKLKPLGYEFMMIFVNVSEATSIARQQSRANKQQQQWGVGRQVDTTTAKNTYAQVQQNLSQYKEYFGSQRFVYVDNENTPDLTQATKKIDTFLRAPVTQPAALEWIQAQKGGQQVAQQQQKLATAKDRQQQALTQYQQGVAEGKMAELEMDLEDPEITDRQFEKMYGMTRKEAREQFSQTDMWAFPEIRDPNRPLHERGVAEAFGPLPKDNQQIRLGRHTVDIERVGLDKNYISFAWHDSQGQEHYEEVAVGDLGSYDDLIDRIKQEISHQERKYTDQVVAEGDDEKIGGRHDPDDFDDMVRRLKKLAGAGPMQTVWDPKKRVYRNMPTAVQPPKHNKGSQ